MKLLFLQAWFSQEILKAIGWTLIHSLWQGLLAAMLAAIIIIGTKKSEARYRYNLLGVVLFLFIITTVITFSQQLNGSAGSGKAFAQPAITVTGTVFIENYEYSPGANITAFERFVRFFNSNADFFVFIWGIFFLFHCIKLFTGIAGIRRIRQHRTHASPDDWQRKVSELSQLLRLKQAVSLFQSELVKVPVAIGYFKPVILVPLGLLSNLPAEQIETILLHELAHIRRKDYLVNIMQRFAEAVFFFNPALLWISSLVRQEREACCDDIVVANTTHKGTYLQALVSFQEYSIGASRYAMAINSKQHYLLNRVKRMITRENKKLDFMEKILLIAGLVGVAAFTFIPKKDVTNKPNVGASIILKERPGITIEGKPVIAKDPAPPKKAIVKRQDSKPAIKGPESTLPIDTVPPKKGNEKEKTGYNDLKFPNISSSINDDGKTIKESTTVTDGNGKTYIYSKVNGKVTSLTIDGKDIPENEYGNYTQLIDEIEKVKEENKARRLFAFEQRKLTQAKRAEDFKNRNLQQNLQRKYLTLQKQYLLEQNRQSRKLNNSAKTFENKKLEVLKLLKQLKERKQTAPMFNGREIIKKDIDPDNPFSEKILSAKTVKKQPVLALQKPVDEKIAVNHVSENISINRKAPSLKSEVKLEVDKELHDDFDYKPAVGDAKYLPRIRAKKPASLFRGTRDVEILKKAEPTKPKSPAGTRKYRVIT